MAINVKVEKHNQESTANLIRRFTKRMQGAGIIPRIRKGRYYQRERSPMVIKAAKLKKLAGAEKYEKLVKLGKIQEYKGR